MKLLISACLCGANCRYDGKTSSSALNSETLKQLYKAYEVIPVCPEQAGGLKTPRMPAEIKDGKVITSGEEDVTIEFKSGAKAVLKIAVDSGCDFAILKARSPSCGNGEIYDGSFSKTLIRGIGVTSKLLEENNITVINENELYKLPPVIRRAEKGDFEEIISLYRSLIGTDGCTWDKNYPSEEDAKADILSEKLYVMTDYRGNIIAAASVGAEEEHLSLSCIYGKYKNPFEFYRVAVKKEFQRNGHASQLLKEIISNRIKLGYDGVFLLAAVNNLPARKLYEKLGFSVCGSCRMYKTDWKCMCLDLNENA